MQKKNQRIMGVGLCLSLALAGVLASSDNASARVTNPSLAVTIASSGTSTPLVPKASGKVQDSYSVSLKIDSIDIKNYTVSVQADSSNMLGELTNSTGQKNALPPVTGSKTLEQMQNEWGYRYSFGTSGNDEDKSYTAMPTTKTAVITDAGLPSTGANTTKYFVLGFGASVNNSVAPDTYRNNVVVSVVGEPLPGSFYDISTMQDMTSSICSSTPTPTTATTQSSQDWRIIDGATDASTNTSTIIPETVLTDTRDNKQYVIRKLADGKCWMVQNLALAGGTTITSDDSNLFEPAIKAYTLPSSSTTWEASSMKPDVLAMNNGTHVNGAYDNTTNNTGSYYTLYTATTGNSSAKGYYSDICPKHWHIPTGWGEDDNFEELYSRYSGNVATFNNVFKVGFTGSYNPSLPSYQKPSTGSYAYWWTSTISDTNKPYIYFASSSYVGYAALPPNDYDGYGESVRCMANDEYWEMSNT